MANNVFANGREISCKKADGKTICAFPDWCMTPPTSPATPTGVPVPYPNTGMAKDTTNGSRTVKITGNEIIKKDVSYYKTSYGDEAGCATPAKKGVITGTIKGKVYFTSWSMDVKVEGKNVARHLDTTTHNHGSGPNECIPWPDLDTMTFVQLDSCKDELDKINKDCDKDADPCPLALKMQIKKTANLIKSKLTPKRLKLKSKSKRLAIATTNVAEKHDEARCARAMRCFLRPYGEERDGVKGCCPGQTPHHIPPWSTTKSILTANGESVSGAHKKALCVCLEGSGHSIGSHGKHHHGINYLLDKKSEVVGSKIKKITKVIKNKSKVTFEAPLSEHIKVSSKVTEVQNHCSEKCIEDQLNKQFEAKDLDKNVSHNATSTGGMSFGQLDDNSKLNLLPAPPVE